MSRLWLLLALTLLAACPAEVGVRVEAPGRRLEAIEADTQALLDEAVARYQQRRTEQHIFALDGFERFETMLEPGAIDYLVAAEDWGSLFFFGDEAFEAERDRASGVGQGRPPDDPRLPVRPRRVHDGERGGLDSSSCRSCHFSGGPDGAGTLTQVALLRGDGERLSSSTVRDAPHVMGLGWLEATARSLELALDAQVSEYIATAAAVGASEGFVGRLSAGGVDFGSVLVFPDGAVDTSLVRGISPDLRIRPFGLKGRHRSLVDLADEALQIHHGHQSVRREETFAEDPARYLGPGPEGDRDDDGAADELSRAQPLLLASYLAMLPVPVVRVPEEPDLALRWGDGLRRFSEVGCAECHRIDLRVVDDTLRLSAGGDPALEVTLSLRQVALAPRPERSDPLDPEPGALLFAFTDLKRHDLGPELAEPQDEVLPDGSGRVRGSEWLTRPLWGLADTAPYLHDGRAPTVHDAILLHGGEATEARLRYLELNDDERADLRLFLLSLTREPALLVE